MAQSGRVAAHEHPTLDQLVNDVIAKAGAGSRIGFASGNFNVVHPGHLRLLQFASENCDFLVVGVTTDATPGVALPQELRLAGIHSISYVDYSVALTGDPHLFVAALKPQIIFKGKEYENRHNPELSVVSSYGGHLAFASGEMRFSSLDLLNHEYFSSKPSDLAMPREYALRHGFNVREMRGMLEALNGMRVLVIGDLIVDSYIDCDPLGMSQEDATIVVAVNDTQIAEDIQLILGHMITQHLFAHRDVLMRP